VRCADVGRRKQIPLRIEPERGQVSDNGIEPSPNKSGDVLQEHEPGLHSAKNGSDGGPDPPIVGFPELLSGHAERLTRESRSDDIHESTPLAAIEGREIVPDRSRIQVRRFHPIHEDGRRVGVPLDVTYGPVSRHHPGESEVESGNPGTKSQPIQPCPRG
jgi:hypothetical protein